MKVLFLSLSVRERESLYFLSIATFHFSFSPRFLLSGDGPILARHSFLFLFLRSLLFSVFDPLPSTHFLLPLVLRGRILFSSLSLPPLPGNGNWEPPPPHPPTPPLASRTDLLRSQKPKYGRFGWSTAIFGNGWSTAIFGNGHRTTCQASSALKVKDFRVKTILVILVMMSVCGSFIDVTVNRGGSGLMGWIGTPCSTRERHFICVSHPARTPCPDSPRQSRITPVPFHMQLNFIGIHKHKLSHVHDCNIPTCFMSLNTCFV